MRVYQGDKKDSGCVLHTLSPEGPVHVLSAPLLALTLFCSHSLLLSILSILRFSVLAVAIPVTLFSVRKHHDHSSLEKEGLISGLKVQRDKSSSLSWGSVSEAPGMTEGTAESSHLNHKQETEY